MIALPDQEMSSIAAIAVPVVTAEPFRGFVHPTQTVQGVLLPSLPSRSDMRTERGMSIAAESQTRGTSFSNVSADQLLDRAHSEVSENPMQASVPPDVEDMRPRGLLQESGQQQDLLGSLEPSPGAQ